MTEGLTEIHACDVCGNASLEPVLDLGSHPLCDDLIAIGDDRVCREYPIEILLCSRCLTAHQRFQVPKGELFPRTYHYRSRFTADVLRGMADLVSSCERSFGRLTGRRVVDIGCNDGSLLDLFRERGAETIGIEPTDASRDARRKGHLIFDDFLSDDVADQIVERRGRPDFVTFTNVFAHIADLQTVLGSLRRLMGPDTVLVIENHYLGSVLDRHQFDTFYHEHARTYSLTSFVHVGRALGLRTHTVEFPARYGGNIRAFLATGAAATDDTELNRVMRREASFAAAFGEMRTMIVRWRWNKSRSLADLVAASGPLRAKAFPGRAAILVKLLGLDQTMISAVFEKPGSLKIGHYVPGTRIPIRSDQELFALADQTRPVLNLAWHIPDEIRTYLAEHGYSGSVVDIVSVADFASPEEMRARG